MLLDTGATVTAIPAHEAKYLEIAATGSSGPVLTDNGTTSYPQGTMWISVRGDDPVEVPVWITPDADNIHAIGQDALTKLGFVLEYVGTTVDQRLAICAACPNLVTEMGVDCCALCSCPTETKARTSPDGACPDKRW